MAGIGFELRRLSRSETYLGLLRAYAIAGVIGSGPWVLSIFAVMILGLISLGVVIPPDLITQFQTSVTWLIALSLIYSGGFQLSFTRYVADRIFEKRNDRILPNLFGILLFSTACLSLASLPMAIWFLPGTSPIYRLLMFTGLNLLNVVWILTVLLTGLKRYKVLLGIYALGYGMAVVSGLALRHWKLEGLLIGFLIGQIIIVIGALSLVWKAYPSNRLLEFDFLRPKHWYPWLLITGVLFNAAVWADKFVFWLSPSTGNIVIGELHASIIYDTPIFLAYFTLIPGMAMFLLRMEVDFVEAYDRYYHAVRDGGTLGTIRLYRVKMVTTAREGIYDIIKVQGLSLLVLIAVGQGLLSLFGISTLFYPLLTIDSLGVALQLVVMATLNIMFYLDRLRETGMVSAFMLLLNIGLSLLSIKLGPYYFGYGYVLAMLLAAGVALKLTDRILDRLNFDTFMRQ